MPDRPGLTVAALAADPALALRVVVDGDGLHREVAGAHTSELLDPTPWLRGGELLMTTGLQLADDTGAPAYVARLHAVGVAGLALGTGRRLTHPEVPDRLAAAARRVGLPLLEVPEQTPFLAITKAVYDALAAARYAEQTRVLDGQHALTSAAVHPGGATAVTSALAALTGLEVLVVDVAGAVLAASPEPVPVLHADVVAELDRLREHGLRSSLSLQRPGRDLRVQPLGGQRVRGFLACAATTPWGPYERLLTASAASLLTLELERRSGAGDTERRRRDDVARTLLGKPLTPPAAAELLAAVGLHPATLRAVAVRRGAPEELHEALRAALPDALVADDDGLVALVPDATGDLALRVRQALTGLAAVAGVGAPVPPGEALRSARQARRAAELARDSGQVVDVLTLASTRLLLELESVGGVSAFADDVLGPVERSGSRGGTLLASLRAFLDSNGSWEEASARLGIHRHTLRQRMRAVEQLTGRSLDSGHDRMELLLAFEARDLSGPVR